MYSLSLNANQRNTCSLSNFELVFKVHWQSPQDSEPSSEDCAASHGSNPWSHQLRKVFLQGYRRTDGGIAVIIKFDHEGPDQTSRAILPVETKRRYREHRNG
jgi:hypothetical protein